MKKEENITEEELREISAFARKDMKAEEIYTFPLILCDNEIDRDKEKFTVESLEILKDLFIGKTGIFDHDLSSRDQTARIYAASLECDPSRKTADGEDYTFVRAKAYMVRTAGNSDLIAEIEAGIKKETSVSCSVGSIKCSVCGKDIRSGECNHMKGAEYGGKLCCHLLCDPFDAYEWSFVAVPAQKNAGVIKSHNPGEQGRVTEQYRNELRGDIIRNAAIIMPGFRSGVLEKICLSLSLGELKDMRDAFADEAKKTLPSVMQLAPAAEEKADKNENNNDYII